jgi:hypothetical protein
LERLGGSPQGVYGGELLCVIVLPVGISALVTAGEGDSVISLATIPLFPLLLSHDVLAHRLDDFLQRHVLVHIRTEPGRSVVVVEKGVYLGEQWFRFYIYYYSYEIGFAPFSHG